MIEVREVTIDEAVNVHQNVVEFIKMIKEDFVNRYQGKETLIIVAYHNNIPIGYMIGYQEKEDGSFYCWMTGVDIHYRRLGALKAMMNYFIEWMKAHHYNLLKIKTRNSCREMLSFLVKNGFKFTGVEKHEMDNRIYLELDISNK